MPEEEKKDKKDDDKIVLQVDMHCEGCKQKVRKALKSFPGLEKIDVDMKEQKVTVKGKLDARKVYETVKKKSGKRTVLLYPDLTKEEETKKEEPKKEEPPPPDPEVTVVLRVSMHCGACAKQIKKSLERMCGVSNVAVDVGNSTVIVKGKGIDPKKVCDRVRKKSGKHCEIVPPPPEEPKKEEAKKEEAKEEKKEEEKPAEEKKEEEKPAEEKKEEEKPAEEKKDEAKPAEEKKEEKAEEKKEGGEEKKEEKAEEKKEEAPAATPPVEDTKVELKKYQYIPSSYRSVHEHVYAPQLFSDENPNACSIM